MSQRVELDGGWTGLQGVQGATADLIAILETVDIPVVVVRDDFLVACFNRAAAEVLGLSSADLGRVAGDVPVLAGVPRLRQRCHQVISSGVDARVDSRDGSRRFVVRISPFATADRQVSGTVLTFTNVTAFHASIEQAIYERECTKAILNAVADPLVVLSADRQIQSANRAFYTIFGLTRDETHGRPLDALGNGAFAQTQVRAQLDALFGDGPLAQPLEVERVVTPKGQRTLLLHARPLAFPGHFEHRFLVTFQDITARKQAEAAKDLRTEEDLRRSEAFLAEGQRLSLTGSFSWNVATDTITWSEQLYRIYELEVGVPVTLKLIRTRVHPEDLSLYEKMRMVEQARDGGSDFEWQYRLLMPDRSIKYLHAVAQAFRDREGRLEYIAVVQDVTERRLAEEALARARSDLAHVARVTTLGALTASIAHEVNQPLAGIITNASTCLRMLDADPPNLDGARETARRTIRDGNRASDVITRLRALFSHRGTTFDSVDLNEAVREVVALSLSELQRHRVIVQTELADDLPTARGDRVQLQQVILNLLLNASDAMSGVDDRPRQLVIRTGQDDGDAVRLTVEDAGVGFELRGQDKLFEAFYTTKIGGMGIGLSVSRSIVEQHHGTLWAAPNDGPGATFGFSIPCDPGPAGRIP